MLASCFSVRHLHRPVAALIDQRPVAVRSNNKGPLHVQCSGADKVQRRFQIDHHIDLKRQVRGYVDTIVFNVQPVVFDNDQIASKASCSAS